MVEESLPFMSNKTRVFLLFKNNSAKNSIVKKTKNFFL